jgi:hypothetical protein
MLELFINKLLKKVKFYEKRRQNNEIRDQHDYSTFIDNNKFARQVF